jgi:putative oxidoreductase
MIDKLTPHSPKVLSLLRVMTGLLFLAHGTQKLLGFPAADWSPPFLSIFWFAGVLELVGGILIVLGLFTRPTAFILSGQMAFAYFIGHASKSFFPINNGGDAAILYCFIFLYLVFAGAGSISLDTKRLNQ